MKRMYKVEKGYVNTLEINGKTVSLSKKERRGAHALLQHLNTTMPGCFVMDEISWDSTSQELRIPMGFSVYWSGDQVNSTESGEVVITSSGTGKNPLSILKNFNEEGNGTHSYFIDFSGVVEAIDHFAKEALILW